MKRSLKQIDLTFWLPLLVTIGIAMSGWFIAYRSSVERDRLNKRRDMQVQYLIEAYRRLETATNRPMTPTYADDLESAIADIQLFGSPAQVEMARSAAWQFSRNQEADLASLLESLRHDLRAELTLAPVPRGITHLRFTFRENHRPTPSDNKSLQ
jgi:hypothetical protein